MEESTDSLRQLGEQLRAEDTPISPHVVDPQGGDSSAGLAAEAIREGYLLHYATPRLLAGHDPDLALLAGDYLYAIGLERLAAAGDLEAVAAFADLISACAQLHTEGRGGEALARWRAAVEGLGG